MIDQGWLPLSRQVGKSGANVKAKLYVAAGISGAPEHVEAIRNAGLVIAVNTDEQAPIFGMAHYGVVADALDFLEGQDIRFRHPLLDDRSGIRHVRPVAAIEILRRLGFRQTIEAAEITAVRDAHPQVAQGAPVRIDEQPGLGHLAGGLIIAGRLVKGGITLTEPSALTSTLRS